jgi:glycine/D-amino acid oxidase-like deaminating enzyme/nitrite reductase/ring-hydroxylating ferredoxin subunit
MILRDGIRTSLWQNTVTEYTPASVLSKKRYDVVIAGGGITGLTLAIMLQQSGLKCIVMEAHSIGFGTTGGTTAHLNTLLDTPYTTIIQNFGLENATIVASAARSAIELVKSNIDRYSIDCGYEDVPAYLYSQTDDQVKELGKIVDACLNVGLSVDYTPEIPIPVPFKTAIKVEGQGKFHPLRYLYALAAAFEEAGGVILEQCRVLKAEIIPDTDNLLIVETSTGTFQANKLVYATHIPMGINLLHLRCPAYRSYAMAVKLQDNAYPEELAYDMYDPYHYYRTQMIDGEKYLIAGGEDHRTGEEPNTNGCFLKLESHIRSHFKVSEVVHRWSSQYFEPVDGLPYIGHLPGNPSNVFVATGYGGNGMTYSHVAAIVLKHLIMGENDPYQEVFSPSRLKPVAGFTDFIKHNADVVKQFVGKWFGKEELQEVASLAPGEGKVVTYEDHTLALYKDDEGGLHAVDPACTHMKCSVSWNAAEKSWDCPCHGARYSFTGEVITGPANKNLEPVEIRSLEQENAEKDKTLN